MSLEGPQDSESAEEEEGREGRRVETGPGGGGGTAGAEAGWGPSPHLSRPRGQHFRPLGHLIAPHPVRPGPHSYCAHFTDEETKARGQSDLPKSCGRFGLWKPQNHTAQG